MIHELKKAQKRLNKKMKNGKKGQKLAEKQSKELLDLLRQQEEIRKSLMEIRDEIGQNGEG